MTDRFEIQTRQKGAWMRYIGGTEEAVRKAWGNFIQVHNSAARMVRIVPGRIKPIVLEIKAAGRQAA